MDSLSLLSTTTSAPPSLYTITRTVFLHPLTTDSVDDSGPVVFLGPLTIDVNDDSDHSTAVETASTTSLPRSIVPSDLKASMSIPTTLVTDTDVHEAPSSTKTQLVSTLTDPTKETLTATDMPESTSTDDGESTASSPTSIVSSTTTTWIGGAPIPPPRPTNTNWRPSDDNELSAAAEPREGLNKLSIALLGLWGVAFIAAWL